MKRYEKYNLIFWLTALLVFVRHVSQHKNQATILPRRLQRDLLFYSLEEGCYFRPIFSFNGQRWSRNDDKVQGVQQWRLHLSMKFLVVTDDYIQTQLIATMTLFCLNLSVICFGVLLGTVLLLKASRSQAITYRVFIFHWSVCKSMIIWSSN